MVHRTLNPRTHTARMSGQALEDLAAQVLHEVTARRATFQWQHLVSETQYRLRCRDTPLAQLDSAEAAVLYCLRIHPSVIRLTRPDPIREPAQLCRRDGVSQYSQAHAALATTTAVVAAEAAILVAAQRVDGRVLPAQALTVSLLESAANGVELNPAQVQLVTETATSGRRVQLALAPAGSGKTTALRALAHAWREGNGTVVALAPTAVAAQTLGAAIDADADTLARLTHALTSGSSGPAWMRRIGEDSLVIIDEAGMAGTLDLHAVIDYVTARGGSVRLVGDDQQLASVSAGGVLRDISREVGAVTLSELMRFTDPAEAAATIAVREGKPEALGFYLDRDRVHQHDDATVMDAAYDAWSADRAAGKSALLLAYRVETVDRLNARARTDRLAAAGAADRDVLLARGLKASAGDTIITRENNPRLLLSRTDWVKNGDQFTVLRVTQGGGIVAVQAGTGRTVSLPADYVAAKVDLGYARTIHGAQGATVDTAHTVLSGCESRQRLYVAASRGRQANHL